jgi:hypothetical protein
MATADFFNLLVEINYSRIPGTSNMGQQHQNGFDEEYHFPFTSNMNTLRQQCRNLVAARVSLFPANAYVFRTGIKQASVCRSHWSLNGNAANPLMMNYDIPNGYIEACEDIDAAMDWRFEDGLGRRWVRSWRLLRDSWIQNMGENVGAYAYDPVSVLAAPQAAATGGVGATATAVLGTGGTAGQVASITALVGGSGYTIAPAVAFLGGGGSGATGHAVLAGGAVSSIVIDTPGSGYTSAPTIYVAPPQSQPWGLQPGQSSVTYLTNFLSCVANYTINGNLVRVANSTFPSGFMTQLGWNAPATGPYSAARVLYEKVGNRQTGKMKKKKKARRKIGI